MTSTHLAVAYINGYYIKDSEIGKIRDAYHNRGHWEQLLPYTINNNPTANHQPIIAEYYLQFAGDEKEETEHLLFDINTADDLLANEISMCGVEEFYQHEDFQKIISYFKFPKYDERHRWLEAPFYILVEMNFHTYVDIDGIIEGDLDSKIVGYLDENLNKILWEN